MKFSLNTIRLMNQEYGCAGEPAPEGLEPLLERIGTRLGAVEEVLKIGVKYDKAVIVKVISCEQHPNADRLHVCTIDDGGTTPDVNRLENGLVQVVCGAPNVRAGMLAVWLPPGATVPSTYGREPFVLEARELRGVISNGMLASPKELALGDSHEGILEIDEDVRPGTLFGEHYGLTDDVIIDIENKMFTHRPDCFGWLGIAREIAGIQGQSFTSPDWYRGDMQLPAPVSSELRVEVRNELPDLVPRFIAVPMAGVTVGLSPVWLQARLARVGLRPINNIVDLTNFYMLLTGQPLHAYDYDKVKAQDPGADHATLAVRHPHGGEKLVLLNGKEIEPRPEAIMIASATKAIGLGGVMGGGDTEVDDNTKNIILECATFDMYSIRRTSMAHGIFSDAVTRFNKGQSPLQNAAVIAKIVDDIEKIAGGQVTGPAVDDNRLPAEIKQRASLHPDINIEAAFINARLGLALPTEEICQLLTSVEFAVSVVSRTMVDETDGKKVNTDILTVRAPFWRTDIEIMEDVVEEVGRLYGFDKLPLDLPRRDIAPASRNERLERKTVLRALLERAGANELLTYSFVHGGLLQKTGQDQSLAYRLSNALSPDLQYFRLSLMPSLLERVQPNIKAGFDAFALFELGAAHVIGSEGDDGLPAEFERLGLVFAVSDRQKDSFAGAPYYQARCYLDVVLDRFENGGTVSYEPLDGNSLGGDAVLAQLAAPFDPGRSALIMLSGKPEGIVGEYRAEVRQKLKLPDYAAGFELDITALGGQIPARYTTIPRFPKVEQDICLRVTAGTPYVKVYGALHSALEHLEPGSIVSSLRPVDIYQREDNTEHKQVTLRYTIASYERTLTDAEVAKLLAEAGADAASKLGAIIV